MRLNVVVAKIALIWTLSIIYQSSKVQGGKTATKVGLAGVATAAGGGSAGYQVNEKSVRTEGLSQDGNTTVVRKNEVDKLVYDLMVVGEYDRALRPVKDPKTIVSVVLDFTMRQIMDLDEKNQILKAYLWMKQIWKDEFLKWNETEYGGISKIWLPATSVWKPDVVIYEETGLRDHTPRLPYYRVSSKGDVDASEPTVIETSCSINILFFPFDHQLCSFTFTSWTFPSDKLDIFAKRNSESMMDNIEKYFLQTGEWTIHEILIVKTSESFASLVGGDTEDDQSDENNDGKIQYKDTSKFRKMTLDITKTVKEVYPDRLSSFHWSDIKYTFILRRNSSLYMQSMLFPAILLTTVALLGFYLPPDSGERIGLQITILLTFMVFLLTVGEMFPASTGPFLGVYYVLCMALLGINLFMTVLVLHLHYMPSAAVLGTNKDGEIYVKPVPRWVRCLLRLAKFRFRVTSDNDRSSPTAKIVYNVIDTGHLSTKFRTASPSGGQAIRKRQNGFENGGFTTENEYNTNKEEGKTEKEDKKRKKERCKIDTTKSSFSEELGGNSEPRHARQVELRKDLVDEICARSRPASVGDNTEHSTGGVDHFALDFRPAPRPSSCGSVCSRRMAKPRSGVLRGRHHEEKRDYGSEGTPQRKTHTTMNTIKNYLKAQNDHLQGNTMDSEVENEWKAIARTIDHLCMQFYILILILSHVGILTAAFTQYKLHGYAD